MFVFDASHPIVGIVIFIAADVSPKTNAIGVLQTTRVGLKPLFGLGDSLFLQLNFGQVKLDAVHEGCHATVPFVLL